MTDDLVRTTGVMREGYTGLKLFRQDKMVRAVLHDQGVWHCSSYFTYDLGFGGRMNAYMNIGEEITILDTCISGSMSRSTKLEF
jgi:hypothetical protein